MIPLLRGKDPFLIQNTTNPSMPLSLSTPFLSNIFPFPSFPGPENPGAAESRTLPRSSLFLFFGCSAPP